MSVQGAPPGQELPQFLEPGPRLYSELQRTRDYAWWRPVTGILLGVIGMLLVLPLVLLPVVIVGVLIQGGPFQKNLDVALKLTHVTPAAMLYLNLTLAALTPYAVLLQRALHGLRLRWLCSVRPGIRWRFLFACAGAAAVTLLAQILVASVLPGDTNDVHAKAAHWTGQTVPLAIVILLTTPLQALGEEFGFRGYLTQAFGALTSGWSKDDRTSRRIAATCAVVLPATLFALAHGTQNGPLFLDRLAFGLVAGFLAVKVGGLEAGIALHVFNNLAAFGIALAYGDITDSLTVTHTSWWQLPVAVVQNGLFLVLVLVIARRMQIGNRTSQPDAAGVPG